MKRWVAWWFLFGAGVALAQGASPSTTPSATAQSGGPETSGAASLVTTPAGAGDTPAAPWRRMLLPRQKPPATQFDVTMVDGERVLRVASNKSYGNLVHNLDAPAGGARWLQWRWRVDQAPDADLRLKSADDAPVRVCAMYDWPHERLTFLERTQHATAEAVNGSWLPTATLCYVWAPSLTPGTTLPNIYSKRIRQIVVDGRGAELQRWVDHRRDLHADFQRAFADEWRAGDTMPPLKAVAVGGDADNTLGEGLAYVRWLRLLR